MARQSWDSLAPSLIPALTPAEIEAVTGIYGNLAAISAARASLVEPSFEEITYETRHIVGIGSRDFAVVPKQFDEMAASMWPRCEALANAILATGNPLSPKATEEPTQ